MKRALSICLAGFWLALAQVAGASECEDPRPIRFAQVPQKRAELLATQFRPLYRHLEQVLGRRVEVIQAPSYGAVVEGLLAGSIDLADLGPAAYAIARHRNAEIVAFASFAGQRGILFDTSRGYHSVLIVRADKGYDSLHALRGKVLSLTDPASTSGALFPRRAVARQTGLPIEQFFRRISFAGTHDRAIEAVQKDYVDAAFVSSTRIDELIGRGLLKRDELRVLWQSETIPFDPFIYRRALCKPLAEKIRRAFLGDNEALRPMFEELKRPGFMPVDDDTYREIREIYAAGVE